MIILKSVCWLEIGNVNLDLPYLSLHQFSVNQLLPGSFRNFSRIWSPRMKPWILCVSIPPWPLLRLFLENVNSKRKMKHLKCSLCSSESTVLKSIPKPIHTVNYKIYKIGTLHQIVYSPSFFITNTVQIALLLLWNRQWLHRLTQSLNTPFVEAFHWLQVSDMKWTFQKCFSFTIVT